MSTLTGSHGNGREFIHKKAHFFMGAFEDDDYAVLGGNQGESITLNAHKKVYLNGLGSKLVGFYVPATYLKYAKSELEAGGGFGPQSSLSELKKFIGDKTSLENENNLILETNVHSRYFYCPWKRVKSMLTARTF